MKTYSSNFAPNAKAIFRDRTHLAVFVHVAAELPDSLGHLLDVALLRRRVLSVRKHSRRVVFDLLHRLLLVHLGERRLPQEIL